MAECTADFEAGTNGSSVLATDTGSETAWDVVQTSGTTTIKYSNAQVAHGSLSAEFNEVSTSLMYVSWSTAMGATTDNYGRVYIYRPSLDSVHQHYILEAWDSLSNFICRIRINLDGTVSIQQQSGAIAQTGSVTLAVGQWTRLEYKIINNTSTGIIECKLFNTADSSTADETITATGLNTRANTADVRFGSPVSGSAGYTYYLDDIVAGATSYPGPVVTATAPSNTVAPVASGNAAEGQTLSCTTGTWSGDTPITYTYQWQSDSSGDGNFSNINGATSSGYVLTASEVGDKVRCNVTATNVAGNATAASNALGPVSESGGSSSQTNLVASLARRPHRGFARVSKSGR